MTTDLTNIIASAESNADKALMVIMYLEFKKNPHISLYASLSNDIAYGDIQIDESAFTILYDKMITLTA